MPSIDCLPDDALAYVFGLGVETRVHFDWLHAASTFNKIRQRLEIDAKKVHTLQPSAFHRSTKKKLFRTSIENAAKAQVESRVLLPLLDDCTMTPAQALRRFILVGYSLQPAQYLEIETNGLVDVFPRLMRGFLPDVSMPQAMETIFATIMRDIWRESGGNERILDFLNGGGRFVLNQPEQSLLPTTSKVFAYEGADASMLKQLLGQSSLLAGVERSRRWTLETSAQERHTRCLSAFAPVDAAQDMEFRFRISWLYGWDLIAILGFEKSREVDITLF